MKNLFAAIFLMLSIHSFGQDLIKGIRYDMPKAEAKTKISLNEDALKITIGTAEFSKPGVIASDGLTKIVDFSEKLQLFATKDKGRDATYNKIKDLKNFFLDKNYQLVYENNLTDANNWLGATQGNALLFQKDSVYLSVIFTGQTVVTGLISHVDYNLNLRITSTLIDPKLFKRWFAMEKITTEKKANDIF